MSCKTSRLSLAVALALGVALAGCGGGGDVDHQATATSAVAADASTSMPDNQAPVAATAAAADAQAGGFVADGATPPTTSAPADLPAAPKVADGAKPASLPRLVVTKSPTCGCCHLWVEHMQKAGFTVEVHDVDDINLVKERVGVPYGKGSCHTAEVGGYFVEGHVPAEDVKRLLAQKPDAKGLAVPGMPAGSPGMELPDGRTQPYVVELVARDGSTSAFAHHGH